MTKTDRLFAGSIPAFYNRYLGPLIFADYAADLARRAADQHPTELLETAAGTGIVTRALASLLPRNVTITATDLNQAMLDFAAAQPGAERVKWQQADAQQLPFPDASFDLVVCQFGAMFFPDRIAAYREARRVLKPGGSFLFSVWDRIEDNEVSLIVTQAVAALYPADPPQFLARTPHGYHDVRTILAELSAAGLTRVAIETVTRRSRAASAREAAIGLCQGTPLRSEITARAPDGLEAATEAATAAIAARFGDGAIDGKMQAHIITASA